MFTHHQFTAPLAVGVFGALATLGSAGEARAQACDVALPACAADVAPVGGNATVNVDDLLAVINTWSQVGPPRPQGDCAPLPNGNCTVNVDDLLAVINAWGPCPGGPANDNCAGAIPVFNGPNNFNNANATTSPNPPTTPDCIFGGAGNLTRDLWFTYTATCAGTLTVDTCSNPGTFSDTAMAMYQTCGGPDILCDDDGCTTTLLSRITTTVSAGQQFIIRVGSWGAAANNSGNGILTITCTPFDNDFCTDASTIAIGGTVNGNLSGSTIEANAPPSCNGVSPGTGRWHKVTGNGTTLTATTCASPVELWDGRISVYCGLTCEDFVCVNAADSDSCGLTQETVSWCAAAGQDYYILVAHPDGNPPNGGEGNYTLTVTSGAACGNPIQCFIPAPANDECEGAVTVNLGANNLNNDGATDSADPGMECAGGGSANSERDIWAKWVATCSGAATFDTCATTSTVSDTILGVYSGTCASLTELACDEDSCPVPGSMHDFNSRVTASVTQGQTYFIRIASFSGSPNGPIVLTISCDNSVVCGNGILEGGEQCDDGNAIPNDGCTNCQVDPCTTCSGTPEGFPCRVDGDNPLTDPNGGCNSEPDQFQSTITAGQTICGVTSTYITGTANNRDTDWYVFTPTVTGNYQIVMCAPAFTPQTGFVTNAAGNILTCGAGVAFVAGSAVVGTAGVPLISNAVLTAGQNYVVFASKALPTPPAVACANGNYSIRVTFMPTAP